MYTRTYVLMAYPPIFVLVKALYCWSRTYLLHQYRYAYEKKTCFTNRNE